MRRARRTSVGRTSRTISRAIRRQRRRIVRRTLLVGGMVIITAQGTSRAVKLSQQDAQRIQQHTGMAPQEMEDDDLNQAMQELSITPQPLTAEDQAALGENQAPQPTSQPAATAPEQDVITQIERLADLHDRGILSDEEFEAKKRQLLGI